MNSDLVQVNWETRKKVLFSNLSVFRKKEIHTDIILSCNGENFPAHRLVLCMTSGYFSKALQVKKGQSPSSLVLVCGIAAPTLQNLLKFIYDGTTTIKSEDIPDLLKAGLMFEIPGLMEMGSNYISTINSTTQSPLLPENSAYMYQETTPQHRDKEKTPAYSSNMQDTATEENNFPEETLESDTYANGGEESVTPREEVTVLLNQNANPTDDASTLLKEDEKKAVIVVSSDDSSVMGTSSYRPPGSGYTILSASELLNGSPTPEDLELFEGWEPAVQAVQPEGPEEKRRKVSKEKRRKVSSVKVKRNSMKGFKKSFLCHICKRAFYKSKSLAQHVRKHKLEASSPPSDAATNSPLPPSLPADSVTKKEETSSVVPKRSARKRKPNYDSFYDCTLALPKNKVATTKVNNNNTAGAENQCTIHDVLGSVSQSFKDLPNDNMIATDNSVYDDDEDYDDEIIDLGNQKPTSLQEGVIALSEAGLHQPITDSLDLQQSVASVRTTVCTYCNIDCLNTVNYRRHRTVDCKILECPFCLSNFKIDEKETYEEHVESHEGADKPYSCPMCGFCSDKKRGLQDHISTHTGIYRFACSACPFQASRRGVVRNHTLKEHPELEENADGEFVLRKTEA